MVSPTSGIRTESVHERLTGGDHVKRSSNRSFGLTFAVVFLIVGCWPLLARQPLRWWAVATAAVFLAIAVVVPGLLSPLNRLWFLFGLLLHGVVSPIVLGLLFFTTVTPIGMLMRAFRKDPLRLKLEADAPSYWIDRLPPGPAGHTMSRQF